MGSSRIPRLLHERLFLVLGMMLLSLTLAAFVALTDAFGSHAVSRHEEVETESKAASSPSLAQLALQKVLKDASPIFGPYNRTHISTASWMRAYPDDTLLAHMNIPGAHDAATWNYSRETQASLDHVTQLIGLTDVESSFFRTQSRPIIDALNAGLRVFDLRYAYDVTNTSLVFWHGRGLQSETATLEDVLFGYYSWLTDHPSEVVMLSFQYEGGGRRFAVNDVGVQTMLYNALTSPAARRFVLQSRSLGTLGESRGKVILLKRFDLNLLPQAYGDALPGLQFSPSKWTDNGADIELVYNETTSATAYIEDYYEPETSDGSSAEENIRFKVSLYHKGPDLMECINGEQVNATIAHLQKAATSHADSLFWSFASSTKIGNNPPDTPLIQAVGNGTLTPKGGVNQQLLPFFKAMRGKRLGIVMFDFYETPSDLIPTFLSLLAPGHGH